LNISCIQRVVLDMMYAISNTELVSSTGKEAARLITPNYVSITKSEMLKAGVMWKLNDWIELVECTDDHVTLPDTTFSSLIVPSIPESLLSLPPLPESPKEEAYTLGSRLYWTVDKDNYCIAVVRAAGIFQVKRCDRSLVEMERKGGKAIVKRRFFADFHSWRETLQEGGTLNVSK